MLACAALAALAWPDVTRAVSRNGVYLSWLTLGTLAQAPDPPGAVSRADALLALRRALARRDWTAVDQWLGRTTQPDRLAPFVVIHEAGVWLASGARDEALLALAAVDRHAGSDPMVWYRVGEAWEEAGQIERARAAYAAGAAADPAAPWSEGRYRLAVLDRRAQQWADVVAHLSGLLMSATDAEIARTVRHLQLGGGIWQEAFLSLGEALERLGRAAEAEAAYARMAAITQPRRDWTLNRGLVSLARLASDRGDFERAAEVVTRALALSAGFDVSHRETYERDTAAAVEQLVRAAGAADQLPGVRAQMEERARASSSAAAWYVAAVAAAAMCDDSSATAAVARARGLAPPGTAAYLTEALPVMPGCASR